MYDEIDKIMSEEACLIYLHPPSPAPLAVLRLSTPDKHCDPTKLQGAHASDHGRRLGVDESTEKKGRLSRSSS
jgi:hypothetical protein